MLHRVRVLLLLLDAANWIVALAFIGLIAILALGLEPVAGHFDRIALPGQATTARHLLEFMLLVGIATSIAVDQLLRPLAAMIATASEGRPFTLVNAARLRHIALALLAIQLLDLAFALDVGAINRIAHRPIFLWSPSITGWIAVLLLFVLARVFAHGAQMQAELEATI